MKSNTILKIEFYLQVVFYCLFILFFVLFLISTPTPAGIYLEHMLTAFSLLLILGLQILSALLRSIFQRSKSRLIWLGCCVLSFIADYFDFLTIWMDWRFILGLILASTYLYTTRLDLKGKLTEKDRFV